MSLQDQILRQQKLNTNQSRDPKKAALTENEHLLKA